MDKSIAIEIKRLSNELARFSSLEAKRFGITGVQMSLIDFLYRSDAEQPIYQTDIEKEFNIKKSSATALLKLMESKELITRQVSPTDSRFKQISLTNKANQFGAEIRKIYEESEAYVKAELGADAQRFLTNVIELQRIYDDLIDNRMHH